jgi:hypothetical protein
MSKVLHIPAEDGYPRSYVVKSRSVFSTVEGAGGKPVRVYQMLAFEAGKPLRVDHDEDVEYLLSLRVPIRGHKVPLFVEGMPAPKRARTRMEQMQADQQRMALEIQQLRRALSRGGDQAEDAASVAGEVPSLGGDEEDLPVESFPSPEVRGLPITAEGLSTPAAATSSVGVNAGVDGEEVPL